MASPAFSISCNLDLSLDRRQVRRIDPYTCRRKEAVQDFRDHRHYVNNKRCGKANAGCRKEA